ncbi:MAG: Ycf66 family protein [Vulcanococcus sp.]
MLASLSGSLALAAGLAVMLLPLLSPELSRPRDAAWGAVVLVLGLTLVTSADRLTGSPMLAVLCAGLLIGRLGGEVMQLRWRQLSPEEQQRLLSRERWQTSSSELATSLGSLGSNLGRSSSAIASTLASLTAALNRGRSSGQGTGAGRSGGKRWVRPETNEPAAAAASDAATQADTMVVSSFAEIDALIEAAATPPHSEAG